MSNSKRKFDSSSDEESDSEDEDYMIKNKTNRKKRLNGKSKKYYKNPLDRMEDEIFNSGMDKSVKEYVLSKLRNIDINDKTKQIEWIEGILKIPWKKYAKLPVNKNNKTETIQTYFDFAVKTLNESVYGMDIVKEEMINYIAQFISSDNNCMPRIIGLVGSPGVGKTRIIRSGLAKALSRPIKCISMGGLCDSSHFVGFDYTYSGSRYGLIVQTLMETGVMNPIIFMDELDKISNTHSGMEIQNLLIHLTDPVQNNTFQDKYFSGIHIDLSKVVFIFSYNDEKSISPILKDRIYSIRVPDPDIKAKVIIGKDYLTKEITPNIGLKLEDIVFTEDILRYIIKEYCENDKGIRGLKKCMETIYLKINTARFMKEPKYKSLKDVSFPVTLTEKIVKDCIKKEENESYDYIMRHMFT
jgi:ATP-dependent Lon protease